MTCSDLQCSQRCEYVAIYKREACVLNACLRTDYPAASLLALIDRHRGFDFAARLSLKRGSFHLLQNSAWIHLAAILCRPRVMPFSSPRGLLCASASLSACLPANPAPAFYSSASEKPIIFTSSRLENVIMRGAYRKLTMPTYRVKTRAACKIETSTLA